MSAQDILAIHPDGIVYSGGPGAPEDIPETVATCKELLGSVPTVSYTHLDVYKRQYIY